MDRKTRESGQDMPGDLRVNTMMSMEAIRVIRWNLRTILFVILTISSCRHCAHGFAGCNTYGCRRGNVSLGSSSFCMRKVNAGQQVKRRNVDAKARNRSHLNMFLGQESGIFGVGAPEVVTIVVVGYFVLGPSELYKLTKEIGKFITNIRTLGQEASANFEGAMENQLALGEIRKAQAELTDAFNFRRSINVDENSDAFSTPSPPSAVTALEGQSAVEDVASAGAGASVKKRRRIKRRKKVEPATQQIEDLELENGNAPNFGGEVQLTGTRDSAEEEWDKQFDLSDDVWERRMQDLDKKENNIPDPFTPTKSSEDEAAMSRFQAQLSDNWNDKILEKTEELEPLGKIMEQLALLEEEREAAIQRIEEEYKKKEETEREFYFEKRALLETAAAKIQANAYNITSAVSKNDKEENIADRATRVENEKAAEVQLKGTQV